MKITLIYPPNIINKWFYYSIGIPLGLATLKRHLADNGFNNIKVIDCKSKNIIFFLKALHKTKLYSNSWPFIISNIFLSTFAKNGKPLSSDTIITDGIKESINKKNPFYNFLKEKTKNSDIVGFSVSSWGQLLNTIKISKVIKSNSKDTYIVLGGPIITQNINHLINNNSFHKIVDGFIVGEGEAPLTELIDQVRGKRIFSKVPNFYYSNGLSYKKSYVKPKDERRLIFPDYSDLDLDCITLKLSKGCPWSKCTFCTYCTDYRGYICMDVKNAIKQIKMLVDRYSLRKIVFVDNSIPSLYLKRLSKGLIKEKIKLNWQCFGIIPDRKFLTDSTPKLMEKSGCSGVRFGVESMAPRVLKSMNKKHTPQEVIETLKAFANTKIDVIINVMFGFPTETEQEALMTLNFLKKYKKCCKNICIQHYCLEEGTEVFNKPKKFGITKIYKNIRNMDEKKNRKRIGYKYEVNRGMSTEEIESFTKKARKELYDKCDNSLTYFLDNY